jgi:hypothetical protein
MFVAIGCVDWHDEKLDGYVRYSDVKEEFLSLLREWKEYYRNARGKGQSTLCNFE